MCILASQYITITAMKKKKKSGQTILSCSMRVPYAGLWAVIYSVITRVLIARAQVRPEQHTLISVFKLNSCKLFQFKHLRARGCELARAVRRCVRALIRSAQTRASELVLLSSMKIMTKYRRQRTFITWRKRDETQRKCWSFDDDDN